MPQTNSRRHIATAVRTRQVMKWNLLFLVFFGSGDVRDGTGLHFANGYLDVMLQHSKYNYLLDYTFDSKTYSGVVDTASELIVPMSFNTSSGNGICISRSIDGTFMNYSSISPSCSPLLGTLQLDTLLVSENVSFAVGQHITNPDLHSWPNTTGIFGLNYPSESNTLTSFQSLLLNGTDSLTFGLDFNGDTSLSTLQLGGVSDTYKTSIMWSSSQPSQTIDHSAFINDLEFCGVPLMANWSNNWPIVVDTASVCLTLPSEYYDIFLAWFNGTIDMDVSSLDDLPFISFTMSPELDADRLYISLADLLVNASAIYSEEVPDLTLIPTLSPELSLCVLKGDPIYRTSDELDVPPIIFGSLTLRSLYFASNMRSHQIGFANKYKPTGDERTQCQVAKECVGQYNLQKSYNACVKPDCSRYYYVVFNVDTGMCEYNHGAYVVGILFLTIISCMEVFTFFTSQHTFLEYSYYTSLRFKPDAITQAIGSNLILIFDFMRVSVFGWSSEAGTVANNSDRGFMDGAGDEVEEDNQPRDNSSHHRRTFDRGNSF
jgi:hypothetical protein